MRLWSLLFGVTTRVLERYSKLSTTQPIHVERLDVPDREWVSCKRERQIATKSRRCESQG